MNWFLINILNDNHHCWTEYRIKYCIMLFWSVKIDGLIDTTFWAVLKLFAEATSSPQQQYMSNELWPSRSDYIEFSLPIQLLEFSDSMVSSSFNEIISDGIVTSFDCFWREVEMFLKKSLIAFCVYVMICSVVLELVDGLTKSGVESVSGVCLWKNVVICTCFVFLIYFHIRWSCSLKIILK